MLTRPREIASQWNASSYFKLFIKFNYKLIFIYFFGFLILSPLIFVSIESAYLTAACHFDIFLLDQHKTICCSLRQSETASLLTEKNVPALSEYLFLKVVFINKSLTNNRIKQRKRVNSKN